MSTTSIRATACAIGLVGTLAVAGCGGSDEPGRGSGQPSSSGTTPTTGSPTAPAASPAPAAPAARAVVAALTELDTGSFRADLALGGATMTREGSYRISDQSGSGSVTFDLGDGKVVSVRSLTVDGVAYGQVDNGSNVQMAPCWWRYDADDAAGVEGTIGLGPEISALLALRDRGGRTTTRLALAASLFGGQAVAAVGLDLDSVARTPISLRYDDGGVLTGWGTTLGELIESAEAAGLDPGDLGPPSTPIDVELEGFGDPVDITAPAPGRQIDFDPAASDAEIGRAITACQSR